MKAVISLLLSFLLILPGSAFLLFKPLQSDDFNLVLKPIDLSEGPPSFYAIDIPWCRQELSYSCGPACLKMIFGYHGWDINEGEIRNVANTTLLHGGTIISDLVRAAHFSNASDSCGTFPIQGYSYKWYGCDSVPLWWSGNTNEERDSTSNDLKQMLVQEKTLILLMWYTELKRYGHYRVLRGYDDREGVFIFADPLRTTAHSGSHWNTTYDTLYSEYWDILPYYAQIVSPWTISLGFSQDPSPSGTFELIAMIDSGIEQGWRSYTLSETNAVLTLPSGYELTRGNKEVEFQLDSMGQAVVIWQVNAPAQIDDSDSLNVVVLGSLKDESYSYEMYTDIIGAEESLSVTDGHSPSISDVTMNVGDDSIRFTAAVYDESEQRKVELQWRKSATNWTYVVMEHIGNNIWETNQDIPFISDNEIIQVRVIAEDVCNNTAKTLVFESTYKPVLDTTALILVGVVLVVVIIALVIIIQRKLHH